MIEKLKKIIEESNNIIFFGGAGVSTESGIPDFRSNDGLYSKKFSYNPEEILSHNFFYENTEYFYNFYRTNMNLLNYEPNIVHYKLAELEKIGKIKCVITQNIDGLHQKAESKNVIELHGSIYRNYCDKCNKFYESKFIFNNSNIPKCDCLGLIKPDIVLYGDALGDNFDKAINYVKEADTLIIAGTSLTVYPASNLVYYFQGKNLVLINKDVTNYDYLANLVINDKLGNVFSKLD